MDANGDGVVSAMDALVGINRINKQGQTTLPQYRHSQLTGEEEASLNEASYLYDTNGDGQHTPTDILMIINYLNDAAEGEGEGEAPSDHNTSELSTDSATAAAAFAHWTSEGSERQKPSIKRRERLDFQSAEVEECDRSSSPLLSDVWATRLQRREYRLL